MNVFWSEPAVKDYKLILEYLINEWGEKVAIDFIDKIDSFIEVITINPKIFPLTDFNNIRKAVIVPQISLYYIEDINTLIIIRLWDNRQSPEKLNL